MPERIEPPRLVDPAVRRVATALAGGLGAAVAGMLAAPTVAIVGSAAVAGFLTWRAIGNLAPDAGGASVGADGWSGISGATGLRNRGNPALSWGVPAGSLLHVGQSLPRGSFLTSPSGAYRLGIESSGDLVLSGPRGALWRAGIRGADALGIQSDGNLIAGAKDNTVKWASGTNTRAFSQFQSNQRLVLQDDGNAVILTPAGKIVWATNTYRGGSAVPGPA